MEGVRRHICASFTHTPYSCDSPLPPVVSFANWLSVFAIRLSKRPTVLLVCYFQRLSFQENPLYRPRVIIDTNKCSSQYNPTPKKKKKIWKFIERFFDSETCRKQVYYNNYIYLLKSLSYLQVTSSQYLSFVNYKN